MSIVIIINNSMLGLGVERVDQGVFGVWDGVELFGLRVQFFSGRYVSTLGFYRQVWTFILVWFSVIIWQFSQIIFGV